MSQRQTRLQITLREVDADNWRACAALRARPEQQGFVMPVSYYLALCHYGGVWRPLAVYGGEELIGFVMWAVDPGDNSGWIGGLTIDEARQSRGLGRAAMEALLDRFRSRLGCASAALSCAPTNDTAWSLYTSLGFEKTGELEGDEPVARRVL